MENELSFADSWRSLVQKVFTIERGPSLEPTPGGYLVACLLAPVLRHPIRAVLVVLTVSFLGWLSGYDVRP